MKNLHVLKKTNAERMFQIFLIAVTLLIFAIILLPLMNIISISVSSRQAILENSVGIFPKGFETGAYRELIGNPVFLRAVVNTVGITVAGTFLSIIVITMVSYALTRDFFGKGFVTYYFIVSMYFSGGLIPSFLLISKYLNMKNSYAALILPLLVNVFYIIVVRSQIESVPASLMEAAKLDGASEFSVVFRVVLPVIVPTVAAICMFIALGKWNMWFPVMIYTNKEDFWTLQYFLRVIVFDKFVTSAETLDSEASLITPQNYQMAAIVLVALPIVSIYPFVQKYFVSGILSGSVKG